MNKGVENIGAGSLFDGRRFNSYSTYFRRLFGSRIQKVAINAGFSCPNRDGTLGIGGCTFCNNSAFTPSYCTPRLSVREQIDEGILFHRNRYRAASQYLAYFQSYSNTYGDLDHLRRLYDEALSHPDVVGVIIGTRPDCVDGAKLEYFGALAREKYVAIEYGVESCYDATLRRINRGHDFAVARDAIVESHRQGIHTGAHFILGLPGESEEMLIEQVERINELPLTTIKFHQLQIFRDTIMAQEYDARPEEFKFWGVDEYISLVINILERMRPDIVMERFASEAPPRYHHIPPHWGLIRNETLMNLFERELERRATYQGRLYREGVR